MAVPPAVFPFSGILFAVRKGDGSVSVDPVAAPLTGVLGAVRKGENPVAVKCPVLPVSDVGSAMETQGALSMGKAVLPFPFVGDAVGKNKRSPTVRDVAFPFALISQGTIQTAQGSVSVETVVFPLAPVSSHWASVGSTAVSLSLAPAAVVLPIRGNISPLSVKSAVFPFAGVARIFGNAQRPLSFRFAIVPVSRIGSPVEMKRRAASVWKVFIPPATVPDGAVRAKEGPFSMPQAAFHLAGIFGSVAIMDGFYRIWCGRGNFGN